MKIPEFKIRCSAISQIMAQPRSAADKKAGLLGQTAKTYCEVWLKEQMFGRKKEFTSKQTAKGNLKEEWSIEFLAENNIIPLFSKKNTERKSNDFLTGECDVKTDDEVIDLKNSWDLFTFPLFSDENKNKANVDQIQGYMCLEKKRKGRVIYTLSDFKLRYKASNYTYDPVFIKEIEAQVLKCRIYINTLIDRIK